MSPSLPTIADIRADAEHCSYNAKLCRFACPVATATGKESVTPWGINRAITAAADAGAVDGSTAAAVYGCTGCRACATVCLPGLDLPTHVRAARAEVVAAGLEPPGAGEAAGTARDGGAELAAGATPGAATVVVPGCRSEDADALARVLAAGGIAYDVVTGEVCCGARTVDVGFEEQGRTQAADLTARLRDAERVVVADPHRARWLRVDHDDPRIVTVAAFLAEVVERLPVRHPGGAVAWQDPCWLGRGLGVYEEPRAVVAAVTGEAPLEPAHTRDRGGCTGGGMGYAETDPTGAARILSATAVEIEECGAATVVTACPTAAARLRTAGLDAWDLTGFVASRLTEGTS
jgi:dimethylglycine catabolism B